MFAHVQKDLRQVLGDPVTDPWTHTWCGGGDLDVCAERLWASLSETAPTLEAEFDSADVDTWQRTRADDAVRHQAIGVVGVPEIHWVNRPTFQQVVQWPAASEPTEPSPETPGGASPGGAPDGGGDLPATGAGALMAVLGLGLLGMALGLRRRR
jgi:hypothetical protein